MTTRSPRCTPSAARAPATSAVRSRNRRIGEALDPPGHRAVPDQRVLLAAAGLDVAVERIVAGVQLRPREPLAVRAERGVEDTLGRADPVDAFRGRGPEGVRVAVPGGDRVGVARRRGGVGHLRLLGCDRMVHEISGCGTRPGRAAAELPGRPARCSCLRVSDRTAQAPGRRMGCRRACRTIARRWECRPASGGSVTSWASLGVSIDRRHDPGGSMPRVQDAWPEASYVLGMASATRQLRADVGRACLRNRPATCLPNGNCALQSCHASGIERATVAHCAEWRRRRDDVITPGR